MSKAKGHNGSVEFDGTSVIITREGFTARLSHGRGEKRIPLRAITAIQWKDPGMLSSGFIQFTLSGGKEVNATKGNRTWAAADDENSVIIASKKEVEAMRVVKDEIQAALDHIARSTWAPPTPTQPPGWYPDNDDPSMNKWWDGEKYTGHRQPRA